MLQLYAANRKGELSDPIVAMWLTPEHVTIGDASPGKNLRELSPSFGWIVCIH